jgi:CheY-like chemotaxis protein
VFSVEFPIVEVVGEAAGSLTDMEPKYMRKTPSFESSLGPLGLGLYPSPSSGRVSELESIEEGKVIDAAATAAAATAAASTADNVDANTDEGTVNTTAATTSAAAAADTAAAAADTAAAATADRNSPSPVAPVVVAPVPKNRNKALVDAMKGIEKILIVDDAASNRKMVARLLRGVGCECLEAEDGQVAIDVVIKTAAETGPDGKVSSSFQMILMDAEMPVMKGPEATKNIRDLGYIDTFIIGVTGNVLPEDVQAFMSHGADAVLPKPLSAQVLCETILRLKQVRGAKIGINSS